MSLSTHFLTAQKITSHQHVSAALIKKSLLSDMYRYIIMALMGHGTSRQSEITHHSLESLPSCTTLMEIRK